LFLVIQCSRGSWMKWGSHGGRGRYSLANAAGRLSGFSPMSLSRIARPWGLPASARITPW
jgi:hypothetical protein